MIEFHRAPFEVPPGMKFCRYGYGSVLIDYVLDPRARVVAVLKVKPLYM